MCEQIGTCTIKQHKEESGTRDGTSQDFLDPTRPVNFKIYAGRPVFTEDFCALFNASNEKFLKGEGQAWVRCQNLRLWTGSQKKTQKAFAFFAKITQV